MFELLGIVVVAITLIMAGRQGENEIGNIFLIVLCGFMLLSALAELKY